MSNQAYLIQVESRLLSHSFSEFVAEAWHVVEDVDFIRAKHVELIAGHLQAAAEGEISRLLINLPPECTRSLLTAVLFPAWVDLLKAGHPIKTVAKWVGNSPEVLMRHYAQVTESDFQKALGMPVDSDGIYEGQKSPPFSPPSTGVYGTSGTVRRVSENGEEDEKPKKNKDLPRWARILKGKEIGRAGLEPATKAL